VRELFPCYSHGDHGTLLSFATRRSSDLGCVTDPVSSAPLNCLPDRFFTECFTGMNCNIEVCLLYELESVYMFFGRITAFFTGKIKTYNTFPSEVYCKLGNFKCVFHITHAA